MTIRAFFPLVRNAAVVPAFTPTRIAREIRAVVVYPARAVWRALQATAFYCHGCRGDYTDDLIAVTLDYSNFLCP